MPVHDWSRVDASAFHHFHQAWTLAICTRLNAGLLPPGYSALVEQHAGGVFPDVLALERRPRAGALQPAGDALAARGNRVAIRHRLGEVVCVIEVVSPGNKSSRSALRAFVQKTLDFLRSGVHLLVVDLLPPTRRDPQGIHKAIWDEFDEDEPFELPPGKPLTLAAYVAGDLIAGIETTVYAEFVGVGDPLPDMPAWLDRSGYVPVPLESSYAAAWEACPADLREWVETGVVPGGDE